MVKIIGVKLGQHAANDKKPKRITYKSQYGDYGLAGDYDRFAILNALGKYEDIGTVEEIKEWLERSSNAKA